MWLNLVAVVVLGVAVVGVVLLAFKAFGRKPPRWILPVAAGLAMLTYTFYNDYSWYARTAGELPDTVVVTDAYETSHPLQPWTYVVPFVDRFAAIDRESLVESPQRPGIVLADVILVQRYMPTRVAPMVFDCANDRRADAVDVEGFDEAGEPIGARWRPFGADDPLRRAVCEGRARATT